MVQSCHIWYLSIMMSQDTIDGKIAVTTCLRSPKPGTQEPKQHQCALVQHLGVFMQL